MGFQKSFFFLAKRFVAGETIDSAVDAVRVTNVRRMSATLDFLGEDVRALAAAAAVRQEYLALLDRIRESRVDANVSVKLSAMGLLIDEELALENLAQILERAERNPDPFVRIDMEGSAVTDATLRVFERAYARRKNVGIVLQAYLKRTHTDVERAIALGARVRLCKGAYNEPPQIAYKSMPEIRDRYLALASELLVHANYPAIATHDPLLIAAVRSFADSHRIGRDRFEFQMLYGCRPALQRELVAAGYRLRIYIPYGTHWAAYFYRRVTERKENAWFALSSMFSR
jgi:proline dehydrogenase